MLPPCSALLRTNKGHHKKVNMSRTTILQNTNNTNSTPTKRARMRQPVRGGNNLNGAPRSLKGSPKS